MCHRLGRAARRAWQPLAAAAASPRRRRSVGACSARRPRLRGMEVGRGSAARGRCGGPRGRDGV
eukprot:335739-Chlamydomonas_euryale.AAC.7